MNEKPVREHAGVLLVFAQLVLTALVIRHVDLFTSAFRRTFYLAIVAFLVNHFIPRALRPRLFAVLCGVTVFVVMGGSPDLFWDVRAAVVRTLAMVAIGGVLMGICLLPIGFWKRAGLLGAAGLVAAWCRAGGLAPTSLALIWPVLAGLFMFRLIVFLHSSDTLKRRPGIADAFSYFFIPANVSASLFPVVDYRTFVRSYYDSDAVTIYQRGAAWIGRGVTQLIVYRVIQQLFAIAPVDVASGTQLVQFIVVNAFLYLKVSGQFHVFVGLLLLFGFNLPETNRRYFLASSFTDYWRRVNVYWKDFILTVFYYPAYFRLKHHGATFALVAATLWSFFVTWALHLYQTWWLKGSAPITAPDVLFWSILALLVLANSLWEAKRGRQRKLGSTSYTPRQAAALALRTAATFAAISVLWSLWSTPTLAQWIGLWRYADASALAWGCAALVPIALGTIVFEVAPVNRKAAARDARPATTVLWRTLAQSAVPLAAIYVVATPGLQARLDAASLQPWYDAINSGDSMTEELVPRNGGYYEHLTRVTASDTQLWETMMGGRVAPYYDGANPIRHLDDFRFREFLPDVHAWAYDADFRTNRWGMRDRDYTLAKPAGTVRMALVGSSHSMGWGVPQDHVFEAAVERRLNETFGPAGDRFEILNFSQNGQSPLGEFEILRQRVVDFHPDIVLLVVHTVDYPWISRDLERALREHITIPDFFAPILQKARVTGRTHEVLASDRLRPYEPEMVAWAYRRIIAEIRAIGADPVAVFLPIPPQLPINLSQVGRQLALLTSTGFHVVDLMHVYDGQNPRDLMLADGHSNTRAHDLVAQALYRALIADRTIALVDRARLLAARGAIARSSQEISQ